MPMKNKWKYIIGILISVIFLIYALSRVNYAEVWTAFSEASYIWTIPMMLTVIIAMYIRALRWQWLLNPIKRISVKNLFSSIMIGFMANNLLPARIGEVVRAISLSRKNELSRSTVFASIVAERAFDSFGLLVLFYLSIISINYPDDLRKAGLLALLFTMALIVFLYLLRFKTDFAVSIIINPIKIISKKFADRAEMILRKFVEGLSILNSPFSIFVIILYSIFLWLFTGISGYIMFLAFDLYPSIWASFIMLFISVLAVSLPSSPGYIGTFHAACLISFELIESLGMFPYDVSNSVALSFSVVIWSCQFFPVTLIGLYYLKKEHLKFSELSKENVINTPG